MIAGAELSAKRCWPVCDVPFKAMRGDDRRLPKGNDAYIGGEVSRTYWRENAIMSSLQQKEYAFTGDKVKISNARSGRA